MRGVLPQVSGAGKPQQKGRVSSLTLLLDTEVRNCHQVPKEVRQQDWLSFHAMQKGLRVDEIYDCIAFAAWLCWKQLAGKEAAAGGGEAPYTRVGVMLRAASTLASCCTTGKQSSLNAPMTDC